MQQADPMRRAFPPADASAMARSRPNRPSGRVAVAAALAAAGLTVAGCGRSAPVDALGASPGGDPAIAGVSITSPDAVVDTTVTLAPDTTAPASSIPQQILYTVQPGDTLSGIASAYGVAVDDLAAYNGITDVNDLSPGQELAIPPKPVAEAPTDPTATSQP